MVQDKYADWRETRETKEVYCYPDGIYNETLKEKVKKAYETKSKDIIELDGYYHYPIEFKSKEGNLVQMIYRYNTKELADAKASQQKSGGGKSFAPRKEYAKSYRGIVEVDLYDYAQQEEESKLGKIIIIGEDLQDKMIQVNDKGIKTVYMGVPYKVEL